MWRPIARLVGGLLLALTAIGIVFVVGMRTKSPLVLDTVRRTSRAMKPLALKSAGTPGAYASVIRHVGRTTGRPYETPVGAVATDDGFDYDLFISYTRDPDYRLARELESILESFHTLEVSGSHELRPLQVCRDGGDFSLGAREQAAGAEREAEMASIIRPYLARSRKLLVLCSARAARSIWVRDEIEWFLELRGAGSQEVIYERRVAALEPAREQPLAARPVADRELDEPAHEIGAAALEAPLRERHADAPRRLRRVSRSFMTLPSSKVEYGEAARP